MADSTPAMPAADRVGELPALTGLRGFAALWVLLFHVSALSGAAPSLLPAWPAAGNVLTGFAHLGWAGVDLFFALSAFLLTLPFAGWRLRGGRQPRIGLYLLRRVLRIYPAYLAELAILLALAAVLGIGRTIDPAAFLAHLVFWFNIGSHWIPPLVGAWFTLPIEFWFYLILPLLAFGLDRRRWPWLLVGALAVTFAYRFWAFHATAALPVPVRVVVIERLPGRLDEFVLGMLGAALFVAWNLRRLPARWLAAIFWLGVAGFTACCLAILAVAEQYWNGHWLLFAWHPPAAAAITAILVAAAAGAAPARVLFGNRAMRWFGEGSFGTYLWHMPIIGWLLPLIPDTLPPVARFWILLLPAFVLSTLAGYLSNVLIERPFLRLGRPASQHPGFETELPRAAEPAGAEPRVARLTDPTALPPRSTDA